MSPMSDAHRVLESVFGFDGFRPGQEAVITALLGGRSVLAVMPTGSGKSLCYQVPALVMGGLTVVVSPLVALMQDQVAALRLAGVAADGIHSGNDRNANAAAWRRAAAGGTRLLYMAPERLMTERMLSALERLPVRMFAIDEAHCISQWGPAFRPEYAELSRLRELFPEIPIVALTATADEVTRLDIEDQAVRRRSRADCARVRPAQHPSGPWRSSESGSVSYPASSPGGPARAASCTACPAGEPRRRRHSWPRPGSGRSPITPAWARRTAKPIRTCS